MKYKFFQTTLALLLGLFTHNAGAQHFDRYFQDRTLRIDYIFAGNAQEQTIALDQLSTSPHWFGKRQHLAEVPMEGNGQIVVRNKQSGDTIYRNSFSTLFQEWLTYDEAKHTRRSFENVFLVPMPKDTAVVTVFLRNNQRHITTSFSHVVVPSDILIRHIGEQQLTPTVTLQQAADTTRCIHIAYVAEGYTEAEMPLFLEHCRTANEELFRYEPFKEKRNRFNVIAVQTPSIDSGTSIPSQSVWKNTALHSHFDTFYSERYLTTLHLKELHDKLAGLPYEHIIILVNTAQYGGGGILNSYNLSATLHSAFKPVVVHEFGHSFAGLADEYAYEDEAIPMYPPHIEPWEPNITTLAHFSAKWKNLLPKGTPIPTPLTKTNKIGVYEGAGYSLKGVYRPFPDCRMRTNTYPVFCEVCQRALNKVIDFYTR